MIKVADNNNYTFTHDLRIKFKDLTKGITVLVIDYSGV
jgi:hypothetical protein